MFAVNCSSVNYALAVSSPLFLLDLIFSRKFSLQNMYGYIVDKLKTLIRFILATFFLLFLKKKSLNDVI